MRHKTGRNKGRYLKGRVRKSATIMSSSLAMSDTCDLDRLSITKEATRSFIRLVETPFEVTRRYYGGKRALGTGAPF